MESTAMPAMEAAAKKRPDLLDKPCTAPGCLDNRLRYAARLKVSSCQVARIAAGLR